jgi:molybdopterin biosynthesis enzyme
MAFAALGIAEVEVFRKVRIRIFSTGSELVSHDNAYEPSEAQIRDSNGPYIEAVLSSLDWN